MFPVFNIGSLVVPTAPLIYLLGIYASLNAIEWAANLLQLPATRIYEQIANAVIVGFVGARFAFLAQDFGDVVNEPLSIIWPLTNGYNATAGLLVGGGFFLWTVRRGRFSIWQTLDALIVGVLVALAAASLADGLARASLGTTTSVPWGIVVANVRRHPTAVYEMLVSFVAFAVWWRMSAQEQPDGHLFLTTAGVLSFGRFLTEAFRTVVPTVGEGYRTIQLVTLLITLAILYTFARRADSPPPIAPTD